MRLMSWLEESLMLRIFKMHNLEFFTMSIVRRRLEVQHLNSRQFELPIVMRSEFKINSLVHFLFQLLPRLSVPVMLDIEKIIENKPVRPPMISTLQMRGLISHGELNQWIHSKISVVTFSFLQSTNFFIVSLVFS